MTQSFKIGVDCTGISVVFACHDGNGKFLLHKRSQNCRDEQGRWDFGGGKLEFSESLSEGVKREAREEYGCEVIIEEALYPQQLFRELADGTKTHWIYFPHIVRVNPVDVIIGEPHSMDEIGWFALDNLPQPLHSAIPPFIEGFKSEFAKYSNYENTNS